MMKKKVLDWILDYETGVSIVTVALSNVKLKVELRV